ncbi:MAG TPA: HepT-like ribonuclease domain-containing protein [Thermoanaerobaculia bacterium]|nr:HepT-like ribonuclease domain-containing protein [Thermoanaerobaculia bacterium]
MTSRERQYLLDILIAAEDALTFVRGLRRDDLETNILVQRAVLQCLTVIGEAAGRIGEPTELETPALPWRKMKDLRNVIVHDYEGVNLPIIWEIVTTELPKVVVLLHPLFPERGRP